MSDQCTDADITPQMTEQLSDLPPLTIEILKRQTIAFLYAIGRAEGVEYKVVTVVTKETNENERRRR